MVGSLALVWALAMRRRYRCAEGLNGEAVERLGGWFEVELLGSVRVARPERVRLIGAGVARVFGTRGLLLKPAGICLGRVVVIEAGTPRELDVLFHELVHTVQWDVLGGRRFLSRYVREVLGRGYADESGLEGMARAMTGRFLLGERFDVRAEVVR